MTEAQLPGSYKDTAAKEKRRADAKKKAQAKSKQDVDQDAARKEEVRRIQLFSRVFGTQHGKAVLEILHEMAGIHNSDTVFNHITGELSEKGTLYNAARRDYYLGFRKYVRADILSEVECYGVGNKPNNKGE